MIYEYNEKEKIVKIDDRTVYLTPKENKIFKKVYENKYITIDEANELICKGQASTIFIKNYIKQLSEKLGMEIDLRK